MIRTSVLRASSALIAFVPLLAFAQSEHQEPGHETEAIVVTGSPLERSADDLSQPVDVVTGDELVLDTEPTLGETLAQQPGVSSSYFGPGASRPIIRGLDADHIRVLHNGLGAFDASSASADHAVTIDPLTAERIEIVRGPMALLYGPTSVGGVVNVIDNRIPDEPIDGIGGAFEGALDSAARGRSGSGMLEGGAGGFQLHASGLAHRARDLTVPGGKLLNSQIDTYASSLGVSWAGERGFIGVAPSAFDSSYGTVADETVTIDMSSRRWDFAGGLNQPVSGVEILRGKLALTDYEHVELEGAEQGTVFKNRGYEGRLELLHAELGPMKGALGGQAYRSKFSAVGAEAFLPPSTTRAYSAFFVEELASSPQLTFQFGARLDWTNVTSDATEGFPASGESRDRQTGSGSVGATYDFTDEWALSASYSYTQRPPVAQELFANGPHVATDAFERGDVDLDVEKLLGGDVSLKKRGDGFVTGSLSGFYYSFDDFITLVATGEVEDGLPVFQYVNLPATFVGGEAELAFHLLETPEHSLHLELRGDYTRAKDRDSNTPLPRIPPLRLGAELAYHRGPLHASTGVLWANDQRRVPDEERETNSYTLFDAKLSYEIPVQRATVLLFLNGTNLTNRTARNSASFLRDVAPLPGRALRSGVRVIF